MKNAGRNNIQTRLGAQAAFAGWCVFCPSMLTVNYVDLAHLPGAVKQRRSNQSAVDNDAPEIERRGYRKRLLYDS